MDVAQASDLGFRVELDPIEGDETQITDFSQLANVIIYAYTDKRISKFSKEAKGGYHPLTVVNATTLTGSIPGEETKLMEGALKLDIYCTQDIPGAVAPADLVEDIIQAGLNTGIRIIKAPIKIEAP